MPAPPTYLTRANAPARPQAPDDSAAFAPARLAQGWRRLTETTGRAL